MKKLGLLLIALLSIQFTSIAQEGWFEQTSGTVVNLNAVHFVNENVGLAVGDSGTILKTTNGGEDWILKTSGITDNIHNVQFADINNVWATAGDIPYQQVDGKLLFSSNQGEDWNVAYIDSPNTFIGLFFLNRDTGWVGGANNFLMKTTNGGLDWEIQTGVPPPILAQAMEDIFFVNNNCGWITTAIWGPSWWARLLITTDGGESWQSISIPNTSSSVFFIDENIGWRSRVSGLGQLTGGVVYKTTNGGNDWESLSIPPHSFTDVYFRDANTGWVISSNYDITQDSATIFMSTNGGDDWVIQYNDDGGGLNSICFLDGNTGWAVGRHGKILKTTTGGVSFVEENEIDRIPTKYYLSNNYPNPFNPSTVIKYSVPQISIVTLKVFDILGNEIETFVREEKPAGTYELTWYAENLPSGVYFYRLQAGDFVEAKKMLLLK